MIAAVATILPAVAVADVMITGNAQIVGTQNNLLVIDVENGTNAYAGVATGAFSYMPATSTLGSFDLEGSPNLTTYMVNVLEINITIAPNHAVNGVLYVNFSTPVEGTPFPAGTVLVTSSPQSMGMATSQTPSGTNGWQSINSGTFSFSGPFSGITTYYVCFALPANAGYAGATGSMSVTFSAS